MNIDTKQIRGILIYSFFVVISNFILIEAFTNI